MADKPDPSDIEVRNPRYKGATPEDVARALLRPWGESPKDDEPESESETEAA
ncbi:MAG: hypothetical protein OXO52_12610 [Rhodospirillales bacterium]|nr:hypothetical protein [Rhodospirillales bacterium]MDE0380875.1 hypothetical protein [Rhodospirillales bacterium]